MTFWMAVHRGIIPKFDFVGSSYDDVETALIVSMGPKQWREQKDSYDIKRFKLQELV